MKSRIRVSLAAPGMDGLLLTQWGLTLLTVGCLCITGVIWWFSQALEQQSVQFQEQAHELKASNQQLIMKASTQGIDLSETRIQALPKEIKFAKQIRKQLGFSWTQFLNDLESTVPPNIAMETVKVNFKEASIALNGSAKSLDDINQLVDRIEAHPSFHNTVLSQHAHKRKKKSSTKKLVLFTLSVLYEFIPPASVKG